MNLIILFRILLDNKYLLLAGGLVLMSTLWYLTKDTPNEYSSSTVIYTGIATGFNIESGANPRYDLFGTNAKFDNLINFIKSSHTQEETSIRLLADHLISHKTGQDVYHHLEALFSDSLMTVLTVDSSIEKTIDNIRKYKERNEINEVYSLIFSKHPFYSIRAISKTSVRRIQNSDLIQLDYSTIHPRITQQTLEKLTEVFLKEYTGLQTGQTNSVVNYFRDRKEESMARLSAAESQLLEFKKKHQIINYYEQTKFIADQKEKLDKDYQEQVMALASSRAALAELENRVSIKTSISLQSDRILDKRVRLAALSSKIAMAQVLHRGRSAEIELWNQEAEILKQELREDVGKLDTYGKSTTGIPLKELLEQWLENAVILEETQAVADVIQRQKEDFFVKYQKFAPIGSELSKIEREISIAEKEYLNNLHSYNQSKLKQQNLEMASSRKILDPPFFPLEPKAKMTKVLVIVGFILGIVLVSSVLIALEFIDSTVKTPDRAKQFTNLNLLGVFPKVENEKNPTVDYHYITNRLIEIMIQRVKLEAIKLKKKGGQPIQINVASSRDFEGKKYLTEFLVEKLRKAGNKVMILQPYEEEEVSLYKEVKPPAFIVYLKELFRGNKTFSLSGKKRRKKQELTFETVDRIECNDTYLYEMNNDFFDIATISDLVQYQGVKVLEYDYVVMILPPLLKKEFPATLVMKGDLSVFVCRANRKWSDADTQALELYNSTIKHEPKAILNGSRIDYLDSMIGEIPKRRSWQRKLAKRIITLDLWSHNNI